MEGGGEGPASEQVVRPAGPQLLILCISCFVVELMVLELIFTGYILVVDVVRVIEAVQIDQVIDF